MTSNKKQTFESALERLNSIMKMLEEDNLPLDQMMNVFEEGMKLSKFCKEQLQDAEERISTLIRTHDGLETTPGVE